MQVAITAEEKKAIKRMTKPFGRTKWFYENAGISWETLDRLRTRGEAEAENVKKVRAFLKKQDEEMAVSA